MKLTKSQLKKIEKFAFQNAEKKGMPHDMNHIKSVTKWAVYIAQQEKADVNVCLVAGLLHDVAGKKYGFKNHEEKSAKIARNFLLKMKLNRSFVDKVTHAIRYHGAKLVKGAKTKEAQIIYEADKTQTTSVWGFCRIYQERLKRGLSQDEAIEKCQEILERHYGLLKTKTAKKLFKSSYQIMRQFYKEYKRWQ
jgi:uncharacterized protein